MRAVRTAGVVLATCLVVGSLVSSRASAGTAGLVPHLDSLIASFPGRAGIWVSEPNASTPIFTHDSDEQVIAASLYKLGVLAEAERRVETGELSYTDPVVIQLEDITADGSFVDAGAQLTVEEALEAMITLSDNGPALALWHAFGGASIDETLTKIGLSDFHIASDDSEENWATPRAVGTFFTLLAKRELVSPAASDRMLARLGRQQISDRLPAQLPADVVVAHKTGNISTVHHDAGIVFLEDRKPYVLVILTQFGAEAARGTAVAEVSRDIYNTLAGMVDE